MHWDRVDVKLGRRIALGVLVAVATATLVSVASGSRPVAPDDHDLAATIFTYDGKDFVRTKTTLKTEDGKSAEGTKLDHSSAAYKALVQKHSYSGETTVFGKKYDARYAPMTGSDGKLTGALFVAEEE